ncbi:Rhodanese-like protein, partial [Patellaria atrata CBS 101060]
LIDVRTPAEFSISALPHAINIPHDTIAEGITSTPATKDTELLLYCRSGRRTGIAKVALERLGFKRVRDLGAVENAAVVVKEREGNGGWEGIQGYGGEISKREILERGTKTLLEGLRGLE